MPCQFLKIRYFATNPDCQILEDILISHNRIVTPEDLGGQDEAGRNPKTKRCQFFQKISFVSQKNLVVEMFVLLINRRDGEFRAVGHNQIKDLFIILKPFKLRSKGLDHPVDEIIEDLHFTRCNSCNGHCCKPNEFGEKPKVSPGEKHLIEEFLKDNNPTLPEYIDGICPFLSEDFTCLIRYVRPSGCRTYYCNYDSLNDTKKERIDTLEKLRSTYFKRFSEEIEKSIPLDIACDRCFFDRLSKCQAEQEENADDDDEDEENEEESILPGEIESFQVLKRILIRALAEYTVKNESERINGFFIAVQEYLSDFSNGIEPQKEFSFGFSRRTGDDEQNELEYVDFSFESEMFEVSSGGHVYDKSVGGDTYSKWTYSIWLNGEVDESYYNFNEIFYLVNAGAELNIELPEEFIDYNEEDD